MRRCHLEASADETHRQQLSFIRQSTEVLVGQLNSENRVFRQIAEAENRTAQALQAQLAHTDRECREERSMAMQLGAQHTEAQALARTLAAENRQHDYARAELRTSFDQNRAQMIKYLGDEFEQKLQWEENEYHQRRRGLGSAEQEKRAKSRKHMQFAPRPPLRGPFWRAQLADHLQGEGIGA